MDRIGLRLWLLLLILDLTAAHARAAQVLGVELKRDGARFRIDMHITLDAPPPQVFRALRDYAAMPRYNPDLVAVQVEPTSEPNRARLFTTVHTCVLFFCKTIHQEQIMIATARASGGILTAELVPQNGAFAGAGRWVVDRCRDRPQACLDIQIELLPQFWVPPVIGPWLIRRKMAEEAQRSSVGLEKVALASTQ